MSDAPSGDPGFKVTVKDVYLSVQEILERLPDDAHARLRRVEVQVAAQWVVIGIVIVGLGALLAKSLTVFA